MWAIGGQHAGHPSGKSARSRSARGLLCIEACRRSNSTSISLQRCITPSTASRTRAVRRSFTGCARAAATGQRCRWCAPRHVTRVPARERPARDGCGGSCLRSRCGIGHSHCRLRFASRSMRVILESNGSCTRSWTGSSSGIAPLSGRIRTFRAGPSSSFIAWGQRSTAICICTSQRSMARSCGLREDADSKRSNPDRALRSSDRSHRRSPRGSFRPASARLVRARALGASIDRSGPRGDRAPPVGSARVWKGSVCTRDTPCRAAMVQASFGSPATLRGRSWIPQPSTPWMTSEWRIGCVATAKTEPATSRSRPRS